MSVEAQKTVWDSTVDYKGTKMLVLLSIAERANKDTWKCWPSVTDIARRCRTTRRTVFKLLKEIEEDGYISRSHKERGECHSSMFTLHADKFTKYTSVRDNTSVPSNTPLVSPVTPALVSPVTPITVKSNQKEEPSLVCSKEHMRDFRIAKAKSLGMNGYDDSIYLTSKAMSSKNSGTWSKNQWAAQLDKDSIAWIKKGRTMRKRKPQEMVPQMYELEQEYDALMDNGQEDSDRMRFVKAQIDALEAKMQKEGAA